MIESKMARVKLSPPTQRQPFAPARDVRLHRHKEWDSRVKASAWLAHIIHREL